MTDLPPSSTGAGDRVAAPEVVADVAVVGLGYVGLTLAVALAQAGVVVAGFDASPQRRELLRQGRVPFHEAGLEEALAELGGRVLHVVEALPERLPPAVVLCVGTPIAPETRQPRLDDLRSAVADLAERMDDDTLMIVRSTVPVGTTRNMILPLLGERLARPLVAFCPERTIQGRALAELRSLPQVVGGEPEPRRLAADLFRRLTPTVVEVSSLEAAELVKLVNNAHTDLIYGFGNEVALIAGAIGVDAEEVIGAANADYPRPDLARPGFVGGSCLEKDPYMLMESARRHGYDPRMIAAARELNERLPVHIAERVLVELEASSVDPAEATVIVSGVAYKGQPETDDVRGSAAPIVAEVLRPRVGRLLGHDFVVADETIASFGLEPSDLLQGCSGASALIILNNHLRYFDLTLAQLTSRLAVPRLVYDLWGVLGPANGTAADAGVYLRLANENPDLS